MLNPADDEKSPSHRSLSDEGFSDELDLEDEVEEEDEEEEEEEEEDEDEEEEEEEDEDDETGSEDEDEDEDDDEEDGDESDALMGSSGRVTSGRGGVQTSDAAVFPRRNNSRSQW